MITARPFLLIIKWLTFRLNERKLKKMSTRIVTHKERKIVLKNFLTLTTLQGISYLLPLVILPYLIRIIGIEKFGLIAFAQSLVQYFMILTDYGFTLSATREISLCGEQNDKCNIIFSSVMTVKLIFAGLSFLVLCAILYFIPKFRQDWIVYILSFGSVIGSTLFPVWLFQGKEKMGYITLVNVISSITYGICIFLFIRQPQDYLLVPLFNSLLLIVSGLWALHIAFNRFQLQFIFQRYTTIARQIKTGWNIFISILSINIYTASRVFAVGLLTNNMLTGYYSFAEKLAGIVQSFPMDSFSQAVYPRISKVYAKNKQRALAIMYRIQDGITLGFVISLPIIYFLAPTIIKLIGGQDYPEVLMTLRLLLGGVFFVGANAFRVQFLLVCGQADLYARIHVTAAVLGLPLIFFSIWKFSYLGAAIATVLIEAGVFILTSLIIGNLAKKIISK